MPTPEDVEEYGVLARLVMKIKLPNDTYKVKFNVIKRVKVLEYTKTDDLFMVNYEELEAEMKDSMEEILVTVKLINEEITKNPQQILDSQMTLERIKATDNPDIWADVVAFNLRINDPAKYKYIPEVNVLNRLKFILTDINQQK